MAGVAAAHASHEDLTTAIAGLVAGAMSMAAGEYVSVHSQADTEKADLERERVELQTEPAAEHRELAAIYVRRGLDATLAKEVAQQLMAHDALGAHARDELGISTVLSARPVQAALASASSFAAGAALPLGVVMLAPHDALMPWRAAARWCSWRSGAVAARVGGAGMVVGAWRVTFWVRWPSVSPGVSAHSSAPRSTTQAQASVQQNQVAAAAAPTSFSGSMVRFWPFAPDHFDHRTLHLLDQARPWGWCDAGHRPPIAHRRGDAGTVHRQRLCRRGRRGRVWIRHVRMFAAAGHSFRSPAHRPRCPAH